MLEVLYASALRNAELRALKVEDVDAAEQILRIREGKGGKSRVVPLGDEAMAWLEEYLSVVRPQLCPGPEVPWLFLTRFGTRFAHATNLGDIVTAAARAAGLTQPVTPHTLRHCCATHMLARGAGLRQLQIFLGHSSLSSTQHYTTVELSALRKVLQRCHPRERRR
jgi:integrase/recombinase XerD